MSSQAAEDHVVQEEAANKKDNVPETRSVSTTQCAESVDENANNTQEKPHEEAEKPETSIEEETQYVTGFPLLVVMTSLTLVVFSCSWTCLSL